MDHRTAITALLLTTCVQLTSNAQDEGGLRRAFQPNYLIGSFTSLDNKGCEYVGVSRSVVIKIRDQYAIDEARLIEIASSARERWGYPFTEAFAREADKLRLEPSLEPIEAVLTEDQYNKLRFLFFQRAFVSLLVNDPEFRTLLDVDEDQQRAIERLALVSNYQPEGFIAPRAVRTYVRGESPARGPSGLVAVHVFRLLSDQQRVTLDRLLGEAVPGEWLEYVRSDDFEKNN